MLRFAPSCSQAKRRSRATQPALLALLLSLAVFSSISLAGEKRSLDQAVQNLAEPGWQRAEQIWDFAEPGYQETRSSTLLADWLEEKGFRVERGVAEIPTAFTATIGSGSPVIAILGEFDALPGLSQEAVPYQQPREGRYYGHACGHHLFGTASAMAAIALGEAIQNGRLAGTVRFYGCPAEEGGSGKVFLVRDHLFDDVDVALHWHPSSANIAGDRSSLARIAVRFRFHGTSAHAAGAPDQGRSALDALELTNFGVNLLREHIPESSRIHYIITSGGDAPNVVPNFAEAYYYVRHPSSKTVRGLYDRVVKCAQAGALATETELEIVHQGGILEILPNSTLADIARRNLVALNDLDYTEQDAAFALRLQETMPDPKPLAMVHEVGNQAGEIGKGSTDVGDVSWVVPTTGFSVACWVPGTPAHSWQAVACGKTDIAKRGMVLAARVLAASTYDVMTDPDVIPHARQEMQRRLEGRTYESLILPDQKPFLDYRKATRRGPAE